MTPGAGGGEQLGGAEALAAAHEFGLGRPAAAHRDDEHAPVGSEPRVEAARQPAAHGRLAHALAGADDAERRHRLQAREVLRPQLGVGGHVARALRERGAHHQEAFAVAHHGLVREVDESTGGGRAQHGAHRVQSRRHRLAAQLHGVQARQAEVGRQPSEARGVRVAQLLAAAGEQPGGHVVAPPQPLEGGGHYGRVVLAVDEHHGARQGSPYRRSSPGTGQMYFSNDAVDGTKSISVSLPWNGYLRTTSTRSPSRRTML